MLVRSVLGEPAALGGSRPGAPDADRVTPDPPQARVTQRLSSALRPAAPPPPAASGPPLTTRVLSAARQRWSRPGRQRRRHVTETPGHRPAASSRPASLRLIAWSAAPPTRAHNSPAVASTRHSTLHRHRHTAAPSARPTPARCITDFGRATARPGSAACCRGPRRDAAAAATPAGLHGRRHRTEEDRPCGAAPMRHCHWGRRSGQKCIRSALMSGRHVSQRRVEAGRRCGGPEGGRALRRPRRRVHGARLGQLLQRAQPVRRRVAARRPGQLA